jgi:transposase
MKWLQSVPFLGKVRTAVLIGRVQTPNRFRTKRQFWSYCGLALETHDSAQYHVLHGQVERKPRFVQVRGLNWNHNHDLKDVFKSAATWLPPVRAYFVTTTADCWRLVFDQRWRG